MFWRYLNSSMTRFSPNILLPTPNSNDLNSRDGAAVLNSRIEERGDSRGQLKKK